MKRILSLFLCILISVSAISPAFAMAVDLTDEENKSLEFPLKAYGSDSAMGVSSKLETTSQKYLFKLANTESGEYAGEYVLLKNVNAGAENGYFVITNGTTQKGVAYNTNGNSKENLVFDVDVDGSIAKVLNGDTYLNGYFKSFSNYIVENIWYTEGTNETIGLSNYKTNCKVALLSLTEYIQNADRLGVVVDGCSQWWMRSPHPSVAGFAMWEMLGSASAKRINSATSLSSTYASRGVRPCFYLSEDFFKNVKIDESYLTDDAEVTNIIRNYDIDTLKNIGYSDALLVKLGILKGSTEISTLTVDGETQVGCTLSAKYELTEGFEQTEYTKFSWEYSDSENGEFTAVDGADKKDFTVTADLNKKYVRVNVTLGNIDGYGETYTSDAVYIDTLPPIIENVKICGDAFTGGKLSVSFDTVSGAPDMAKSRVIWYWADEKDGEFNVIDGANGFEYTVDEAYGDKYITAAVVPANVYEIFGDEAKSEDVLRIVATVDESKLETKLTNVYSTPKDIEMLDTVTPDKYTFKIAKGIKSESGKEDKKSYILLKNVNAKSGDGYFVMLENGGLYTSDEGSAVNELKKYYPGTYSGEDKDIIAKNYEMPTRTFDATNKKSIAYYLNRDEYMASQFPVMYEGGYINDHTWYTESGILENGEVAYASNSKIALISMTEYLQNVDRIGMKTESSLKLSVTNLQTRTPHPTVATTKHTNNTYTVPSIWLITSSKAMQAQGVVYLWQTLERPVFYLDAEFFRNVKISANENSALADVLKEVMSYEDMLKMGYTKDELAKIGISESYPTGKNAVIKGHFASGNVIYADYDFAHTDKNGREGATKYQWYVSNGTGFDKIDGETDETYLLKDSDVGKTIKVEITPYDQNGNMGKMIFARSSVLVSANDGISFSSASIGGITSIDGVTEVNASVDIKSDEMKNVKLYAGVFDKKTNKCIRISEPNNISLSLGVNTYPVSVSGFAASENNYIKLFVLDNDNRPLFGIEYFKR